MKKAIPPSGRSGELPKPKSRATSRPLPGPEGGHLNQMAAMANRSPSVQAQRKLAQDLGGRPRVESPAAAETLQMRALDEQACTNAAGCACAGCAGKAELPVVSQAKLVSPTTVVTQLACDLCGKDKGHYSDCPRHKHNRGVKAQEQQEEHEESSSWTNIKAYRPGWVKRNGITEELVRRFCKETGRKIRGHHSQDKSKKEQANTTDDLNAYKSWHTEKFDEWN
jgi:hypothetical protein